MFHLINYNPGSIIYLWPDWLVELIVGAFLILLICVFWVGIMFMALFHEDVGAWFGRVWAAVTFKAARGRRRAAREAAQARDARTAKILADIIAGAEPPVKNPLQWPYATDYVAAANKQWDETTTPERKNVYPWIIVDGRTYAASEFIFRHDHQDLMCVADIEHAATGVRGGTSLTDTGHGLRKWIDGDPISDGEVRLITSFLRYTMAEAIRRAAPTKLEQTLTQHRAHGTPNPNRTQLTPEQELTRLRATNARLENELRDLRRDNDLAIREYEQSKHAIKEAERTREILDTVAQQRAELQSRLAAARLELAEQKRRNADAGRTIANLHRDLTLVIAKGRRRKAAIRKLQRSNNYATQQWFTWVGRATTHAEDVLRLIAENETLTQEVAALRRQIDGRLLVTQEHTYTEPEFMRIVDEHETLKQEVADRDQIIDDYHDAATRDPLNAPERCREEVTSKDHPALLTPIRCDLPSGHDGEHHASYTSTIGPEVHWVTPLRSPRNPL